MAVLERYVELLAPQVIDPAFARSADPIERIFAVLDGYRALLVGTDFKRGCPIGNLALEMSAEHDEVRRLVELNFGNWCKAIERCLDAAGDRLPPGLDRSGLAGFVLTVMEGGIMRARAQCSVEPFDAAVGMLRDYFDRLLGERAAD